VHSVVRQQDLRRSGSPASCLTDFPLGRSIAQFARPDHLVVLDDQGIKILKRTSEFIAQS